MDFEEDSDYRARNHDYRARNHDYRLENSERFKKHHGNYRESERSLHFKRSHKSKRSNDHRLNERSKRQYRYDDRYRERSRSNSRARNPFRGKNARRSHSSDRSRYSPRNRYESGDRHYSRSSSRGRDRFLHKSTRRSHYSDRSRYSKSHRTRYGSGERHYSHKGKHEHYKDRDNYYLGPREPGTHSTIGGQDISWENEARRESVSNCATFTQTMGNNATYPLEPFLPSYYHQNTYPMRPQILQPNSNLLRNAPFPYEQENADVNRLLDISISNFLNHVRRSSQYAQPVTVNMTETPSLNATVFHEAQDSDVESESANFLGHVLRSDHYAQPVNVTETSSVNETVFHEEEESDLASESANFLDHVLRSGHFTQPVHEAEDYDLASESVICGTEVRRLSDSDYVGGKIKTKSEENKNCEMGDNKIFKLQLRRLSESFLSKFNGNGDVCVSQDDAVNPDQQTNIRAISQEDQTIMDRVPVTNKEINTKRPFNQVNDDELKSDHEESMVPMCVIKNNNREWHSLNKGTNCKICKVYVRNSLVSHYINVHPKSEVIPSRVSPDVGNFLRNSKNGHKSEKIKFGNRIAFNQFCYFCNDYVCLTKYDWMYHLRAHTGYYKYKCTGCFKSFIKSSQHTCKDNTEELSQPQLGEISVVAYLCDFCNYVRLDKTDIENHLKHQHEGDVTNNFKEVIFLTFPLLEKKHDAVNPNESNEELITESSEGMRGRSVIRLRTISQQDRLITPRVANGITNEKVKRKRNLNQVNEDERMYDRDESMITANVATYDIKNNNPEWHSLNKGPKCKICNASVSHLVNHYVNVHPSSEVIPSRVSPDVGNFLRNSKNGHKSEKIKFSHQSTCAYKQFCYFCNDSVSLSKPDWIYHLRAHTGYYKYRCDDCFKSFIKDSHHICKDTCNMKELNRPQFEDVNITAFVCDLCNYVRLNKTDIENHLKYQHEGDVTNRFEEVIFLSFPIEGKQHEAVNRKALNTEIITESSGDISVVDYGVKMGQKNSIIFKNIDPQCHSTNHGNKCKICKTFIMGSIVAHYVNVHPNSDVVPCRVAPDVGDLLRKQKDVPKCEAILQSHNQYKYKQICYFCNESMCLSKNKWMKHMRGHSGYYRYKCVDCSKKLSILSKHSCKDVCNVEKVSQPQFDDVNLMGYLCDLCNYVRFDKTDIEKHLKCEHEGDVSDKYQEIIFLIFAEGAEIREVARPEKPEEKAEIAESLEGVRNVEPLVIQQTFETRSNVLNKNDINEAKGEAKILCKQDKEKSEHKKLKKISVKPAMIVKNIDLQYHSTNHGNKCKICKAFVTGSIVSHYVNVHPNNDVFPSRVAPDVGDLLRKSKDAPKCEAVARSSINRKMYKEFCYFCNKYLWKSKYNWIIHLRHHTGYYRYKCAECLERFIILSSHVCEKMFVVEDLSQPQFEEVNIMAFVCDLCNYVRLNKTDIENHLKCEHEGDVTNKYEEVILLSFPGHRKRLKSLPKMLKDDEIVEPSEATSTIPSEIKTANEM